MCRVSPLAVDDLVGDGGGGLDQREVALALEPLLDDLHVEHAQEAAAEAEPERVGRLGLEREARVVERQLLQGGAQVVELVVGGRKQPAEDDRHGLLVSGQGHLGRPGHLGDRVADADVGEPLDIGDDVADLPDAQLVAGDLARPEPAQAGHLVFGALGHEPDLLADPERAVDDPDVGDDPLVVVELGIEDQGPQRCLGIARRGAEPAR